MPAVTSGKVLVTGANGYVGVWTLKAFLDAGFSVRGGIRDNSKAVHLKKALAEYGNRLEFAIVPDITKVCRLLSAVGLGLAVAESSRRQEGAFDDAAVGVDAIVHTASPVHLTCDDPNEQIVPAVEGTLNALRAAAASGCVKRVVFVSSCVTVLDPLATGPRVYDETCWNESDVAEVETKGRGAAQLSKYCASKTLAERRAWEFYERATEKAKAEGKGSAPWDLTVINPPWVFGPVLQEVKGGVPEGLNDSNGSWFNTVMKGEYDGSLDSTWIDGRDLAHALVLAVEKAAAGGQRIIVASSPFRWQDFVLAAHRMSGGKTTLLKEEYNPDALHTAQQNVRKAKDLLGITYRSVEETTEDILGQYETFGWL
ncbi:D-lactaldehyde dehydrogenase [Fomes fomentarius]|nr:D-lactaldehyde dehydrogenase [Fomes fomentarius]